MEYNFKYAIQRRDNGIVCDYAETLKDALKVAEYYKICEVIEIATASKITVEYAECGGPNGYGHHEVSFETYGPLRKAMCNLINWMKHTTSVFGPDFCDVRDFFRGCSLTINGKDYTKWMLKQTESITKDMIFV